MNIRFFRAQKKFPAAFAIVFFSCCLKLFATGDAQANREKFVAEVKSRVGSPYVYGAAGPDSFDCSGLIYYSAKTSLGLQLPRTAKQLYNYCRAVPSQKAEFGDLVFFKSSGVSGITHVGIYIGRNQFISAISDGPNAGVVISSLNQDYWKPKFAGFGQFLPSAKGGNLSDNSDYESESLKTKKSAKNSSKSKSALFFGGNSFLTFDTILSCGWSFYSGDGWGFKWRGISLEENARFSSLPLEPGVGIGFRYDSELGAAQIPLSAGFNLKEYMRIYAAYAFAFPVAAQKEPFSQIIAGATLNAPEISVGKAKVRFVHDISCAVFSDYKKDKFSSSSPAVSFASSVFMFTGVKISFGANSF